MNLTSFLIILPSLFLNLSSLEFLLLLNITIISIVFHTFRDNFLQKKLPYYENMTNYFFHIDHFNITFYLAFLTYRILYGSYIDITSFLCLICIVGLNELLPYANILTSILFIINFIWLLKAQTSIVYILMILLCLFIMISGYKGNMSKIKKWSNLKKSLWHGGSGILISMFSSTFHI